MLASVTNDHTNFICTALPEITWLLMTRYIRWQYLIDSFQYVVKKETVLKSSVHVPSVTELLYYTYSFLSS